MKFKENMQTNISLVSKDGKVQARLNYRDNDIPEGIYIETSGENTEEVITNLYDKMMDSIDKALTEPEEELDETTAYIKRLEAQIEQLSKENKELQKKKEVAKKSPWYMYDILDTPYFNSERKFEDLLKELFQ